MRLNRVFGVLSRIDADDIFISYSRHDGAAYLTGLDVALSAEEFSCLTDRRGTDADSLPPESLYRKIRKCKSFVLVGSPGALENPGNIAEELRRFTEENGTDRVTVISFDKGLELEDWSGTPWWNFVVGKARERDFATALKTGRPDLSIIKNITSACDYVKSKDRLIKYRNRAFAAFIVLVAMAAVAGSLAIYAGMEARLATLSAERQLAISDSVKLANRSQALLQRPEESVERSIMFAIESYEATQPHEIASAESDAALRASLAKLPRFLGSVSHQGEILGVALSPDGGFFATASKDLLRIFPADSSIATSEVPMEISSKIALSSNASHVAVVMSD